MSKLNVYKMSEIFLFTKDVLLKQHQVLYWYQHFASNVLLISTKFRASRCREQHLESLDMMISQLVNVTPPNGYRYYFAYGPDMNATW